MTEEMQRAMSWKYTTSLIAILPLPESRFALFLGPQRNLHSITDLGGLVNFLEADHEKCLADSTRAAEREQARTDVLSAISLDFDL